MAKIRFLPAAAVMAWSVACGAGDMSAEDSTRGRPSGPGATAADPDGAGAAGSGALIGDNSTWVPTQPAGGPLPEEECVEGERCYAGASPDVDNCGTVELNAKVETVMHPGNVLLVFDTSFSMTMDWNGMPRSQQAGPAIVNALTPLQDLLTIGTVFFPRAPAAAAGGGGLLGGLGGLGAGGPLVCGVTPITSTDQINFKPGPEFLAAFNTPVNGVLPYTPVNLGATPPSRKP